MATLELVGSAEANGPDDQRLTELRHILAEVRAANPEAQEKHLKRGRLLVRDRIDLLLDAGAPFLELSPLAGWGTEDPLGGGTLTGIGTVSGVECVIVANDSTVRGGSTSPTTVRKVGRALEIALDNRLPLIHLVESGGAELTKQAAVFLPGGAKFRQLSELSAAGVPTLAVVFGPSTAGGAYVPGMSDFTVMVRGQSKVYLGGPPLVRMATNEEVDEESLGGAAMHATVSGVADYLVDGEYSALMKAREIILQLRWTKQGNRPSREYAPPVYPAERMRRIVPSDPKQSFDARDVLACVLDGSEFEEFKPLYGPQLVCGWGQLHGYQVGVIANNGVIFNEEAQKSTHFIQLCNRSRTPLLFMHNVTGFMVGRDYERRGIIKDGARLIHAISNSTVPHLVVMLGASYGAGNYAMGGRAFRPRMVFTWPSHRIAVMGGKQAAGVLTIIRQAAAERAGREFDEARNAQSAAKVESTIEQESTALFSTGQVWDDGVIDPAETRDVLGLALSAVSSAPPGETPGYAVFRM